MIIISATGGSGSTFVRDSLRRKGYKVCARPDAGRQKLNQTMLSTWKIRTKPFFSFDKSYMEDLGAVELFHVTYNRLKRQNNRRLVLMLLEWGAMGFLKNKPEKPIYLVRDPLYTITSYSSGTSFNQDKGRRIKYAGGKDHNDPIWIDAFFGEFSWWMENAEHAIQAVKEGRGHIVRYYRFKEDWSRIPGLPDITDSFKCKNDPAAPVRFFSEEALKYIEEKTKGVWNEVMNLP